MNTLKRSQSELVLNVNLGRAAEAAEYKNTIETEYTARIGELTKEV